MSFSGKFLMSNVEDMDILYHRIEYKRWLDVKKLVEKINNQILLAKNNNKLKKIHKTWVDVEFGYFNFLHDMGPAPSRFHLIMLKDKKGDFTPWNCVWRHQYYRKPFDLHKFKKMLKSKDIEHFFDDINYENDLFKSHIYKEWKRLNDDDKNRGWNSKLYYGWKDDSLWNLSAFIDCVGFPKSKNYYLHTNHPDGKYYPDTCMWKLKSSCDSGYIQIFVKHNAIIKYDL